MKKKSLICVLLAAVLLLTQFSVVFGQDDSYSVHLSRNFGYGGGVNVRGTFTISLRGDDTTVSQVRFMIDEETLAEVESAPFSFQFHTDDQGFGYHDLWAEVELNDGTTLTTSAVQYNFVSPEEERAQVGGIFGTILGGIVVTVLVVGLIQVFVLKGSRKGVHQPGEPRNYGLLGGTICPKCGRPFPRHIWGINLLAGKLDRCENCGKWVMTIRASESALHAAEEAERAELAADEAAVAVKPSVEQTLNDTQYIDQI